MANEIRVRQKGKSFSIDTRQPVDDPYNPWQEKAVLSFDGGGVRGYASLLILKALMETIAKVEQSYPEECHNSSFCPRRTQLNENIYSTVPTSNEMRLKELSGYVVAHYFDYVAGTSTGGLNAIMLGRLRMTAEECVEKYPQMVENIFGKRRRMTFRGIIRARYSATGLEEEIEKLVNERTPANDNHKPFSRYPSPPDLCRTIVIAKAIHSTRLVEERHLFRTYDNPVKNDLGVRLGGLADHVGIKKVARATSAAPGYFDEIEIGKVAYSDGAVGFNNPAKEAYEEIRLKEGCSPWGSVRRPRPKIPLLVSIGTGRKHRASDKVSIHLPKTRRGATLAGLAQRPVKKVVNHMQLMRRVARELTDVERVHNDMRLSMKSDEREYYRWDVDEDIGALKLDEWKHARHGKPSTQERIEKAVEAFLEDQDIQSELMACATQLVELRRERIRADPIRWRRNTYCIKFRCSLCGEQDEDHGHIKLHLEGIHGRTHSSSFEEVEPEFPGGPF